MDDGTKGKLHVITEDLDLGEGDPNKTWSENVGVILMAGIYRRLAKQDAFENYLRARGD